MDLQLNNDFSNVYNGINNTLSQNNPIILISLTVIIIFYYLIFNYLGVSTSSILGDGSVSGSFGNATEATNGVGITLIEIFLWGLFIFLILINGLQYFFELDIKASIKIYFLLFLK